MWQTVSVGGVACPRGNARRRVSTLREAGLGPSLKNQKFARNKVTIAGELIIIGGRTGLAMKNYTDRHYLHEFMTGRRPPPRMTRFTRFINLVLWLSIVSLLAALAYLLMHG
jgi:hypothetical protein